MLDRAVCGGLIVNVQAVGLFVCSAWTVLCVVDSSSVCRPLDISCGPPGPCCWTVLLDRAVYDGLIVSVRTIGLHVCPVWTVLYMADAS